MKRNLWFRAKDYGWGWYPVTWQGWLVTALFVVYETFLTVLIGNSLDSRPGISTLVFLTVLGIAVLMAICFRFGETPSWRWGKPKKK